MSNFEALRDRLSVLRRQLSEADATGDREAMVRTRIDTAEELQQLVNDFKDEVPGFGALLSALGLDSGYAERAQELEKLLQEDTDEGGDEEEEELSAFESWAQDWIRSAPAFMSNLTSIEGNCPYCDSENHGNGFLIGVPNRQETIDLHISSGNHDHGYISLVSFDGGTDEHFAVLINAEQARQLGQHLIIAAFNADSQLQQMKNQATTMSLGDFLNSL